MFREGLQVRMSDTCYPCRVCEPEVFEEVEE